MAYADFGPRLLVALDYPDANSARQMLAQLNPALCRVKIGKELFTVAGPDFVREVVRAGYDVFLDLKFHDIPNTVAKAVAAAAELGVWMVNVHASGGSRMMRAAAEAIAPRGADKPLLIGVTVLTSMGPADLSEVGVDASPADQVSRLASLAIASGLDGVVCSAQEASLLRQTLGADAILVTPGIRMPEQAGSDDQKRTMGPAEAIAAGATYLVAGRPITASPEPMASLKRFLSEISYKQS